MWAESAGALTLLLLVTLVVSTLPLGLVAAQLETERQINLAMSLTEIVTAASSAGPAQRTGAAVLSALQATSLDVDELYLVDQTGGLVASVAGAPPGVPDQELRAALDERAQSVRRVGARWFPSAVVLTSPVDLGGTPGALRVRVPVQRRQLSWVGLLSVLVIPAVALLSIVFFSAWVWLRRNLVRPIEALRDAPRRIAQGQFGAGPSLDAPAELLDLRDDLDALSRSLRRYRRRTRRQVARLRSANADLARAQDALVRSEKLAGLGRIAAGLAHEVGNPLTAVIGFQDLLAEELDAPGREAQADLVRRSRRELERIHRTLRRLLDYARPGPGLVEDLPLRAALEDAVASVRAVPAVRGLRVEVEAPTDLPRVRFERDKLHQVLVNLLLNAADAIAETRTVGGSLPGRVVLRAARVGDEVEVRCEDSGPGFSAGALGQAFEPFFTTKALGAGTGLGLAMCQHMVEAAGGQIAAENLPEGGACVRFTLPMAAA